MVFGRGVIEFKSLREPSFKVIKALTREGHFKLYFNGNTCTYKKIDLRVTKGLGFRKAQGLDQEQKRKERKILYCKCAEWFTVECVGVKGLK